MLIKVETNENLRAQLKSLRNYEKVGHPLVGVDHIKDKIKDIQDEFKRRES